MTWQPIETAPKDEYISILVYAKGEMYVATYNDGLWCVSDNKNEPAPIRGYAVTHWMPLPEPPKEVLK